MPLGRGVSPNQNGGNLGSPSQKWNNLYVGKIYADEIAGVTVQQRNAYFAVETIVHMDDLPTYLFAECITAGTTAATAPAQWASAQAGDVITDGTAVFLVERQISQQTTPAFNKRDVVTVSGTYTAPVTGWYKITAKGGGGGGLNYTYVTNVATSGTGGGEGGTSIGWVKMSSGDSATVTIGAGGAASTGGTGTAVAGGNGGTTTVSVNDVTITATGGYGGGQSTNGSLGGTGTINGASGVLNNRFANNATTVTGGPGGGAGGGNNNHPNGISGGGGAGGSGYGTTQTSNPGAGGDGYVWFEYFAEV